MVKRRYFFANFIRAKTAADLRAIFIVTTAAIRQQVLAGHPGGLL
jgi:hypothetical protein